MKITRRSASVLALLAAVAGSVALATTFVADAQLTPEIKRARLTIDCTVTRGASQSPCRGGGRWRLTGGLSDSGRMLNSQSDDTRGGGAKLTATLLGKKGRWDFSDGAILLSHKRRGCLYVSTFRLDGTSGENRGFSGGSIRPGCMTLRIGRRTIKRRQTLTVRVRKG